MRNIPQVFPIFLLLLQTHLRALGFCLVSFQTQKKMGANLGSDLLQSKFGPPTSICTTNRPPARPKHRRSLTYTPSSLPAMRHAPLPRLGNPFKISQTKTPPQPRSHPLHHHFHHAPISSASYSSVVTRGHS